ncbi:MAG: hypothetical protein NT075_09280 [Chloroflexi bacterium]|nr:hypothetical protein [Chloroflexota bacterium]
MTSSRYPQITDELLSAYIDDAITKEEKAIIETAMIDEPAIAWRLETLRYTITLLNSLPAVTLPRSFAISELQATSHIGAQTGARAGRATVVAQAPAWRIQAGLHNLGESWRNFWQIGNLFLRNAAAVSLAIFLVLVVSNEFVATAGLPNTQVMRQSSSAVTAVASNAQSGEVQKIQSTAIAQAPTTDPRPLAATAIASQPESARIQATSASAAVGPLDSQATNSSAAAEAPGMGGASRPQADAVQASNANSQEALGKSTSQPGPDNQPFGEDDFAPSPPTVNGPASPPNAAPGMQIVTPKTAASGFQSATNSPLMEQQAASLATVARTESVTPTPTITNTVTVMAYNAQSQATVEATRVAPTLVTNNQAAGVPSATAPQVNGARRQWSWLSLAQLMSAFMTVILGVLWWRSGDPHYRMNRQQR